ncbi:PREDICTED: uncharacterized protein LOC109221072 [Nicotiana attenuata]|uniref:uncharacterized protein LOC109221072 n=1 Tax=Nicotiana attenuata TaxID=49451 RepID=UPI0009049983|nr:PREDICTED: uncharacterized protein LOC109221072 [Nicotiana attenuata]
MDILRNKRWMYFDRVSKEYLDGVEDFLNHAFSEKQDGGKIACPCTECVLLHQVNRATAYDHLVVNGIIPSYDTWSCHGESLKGSNNAGANNRSQSTQRGDDMRGMIHDAFAGITQFMDTDVSELGGIEQVLQENTAHPFGNQPHLEVDKFERLMKEANEELYPGCKKFSKLSCLLHLYQCMFKWSNESFNSFLGLLKDVLPEGEKLPPSFYETKKIVEGLGLKYEKIHACPNDCMLFRKEFDNKNVNESKVCEASRWKNDARKIPAKVLSKYPKFAGDPRNVHQGLASDGFNPFGTMRTVHKELNELWDNGIETCDASAKEIFQMRAALMWTINDFSAYGTLSRWCTYGRFACPSCNINTQSRRLTHGRKFCYMGHRRFLKSGHKYRNDAKSFDGTKETRPAPCPVSGALVLNQVKDIKFTLGQSSEGVSGVMKNTWRKRSIFFDLPYWKSNLVRHNLDVMHIEKNVCDNLIYTLLDLGKKSKDNSEARLDLKEMKIRPSLWPQYRASGKAYLPPTFFTMSQKEKELFYEVLQNAKFPDGYASNISRCIRKRKISGLKLMIVIKELKVEELKLLEEKIPETLSTMEKLFLPGFFTVMIHLVIHLATEANHAGPVHCRWMYPIDREHIAEIKRSYRKRRLTQHQLDRVHFDTFHEWLKEQIKELEATSNILKDVKVLAQGPSYIAKRFHAFDVNNRYRFRMKQSEEFKVTQNSGVMVISKTESYASTSDNTPKSTNITYYGRLNDIVELNYYEELKVVLFKCDWVDVTKGRGVKEYDLGFKLVNFSCLTDSGDRERHEPFILAEQAQQVIFVQDPKDHEWFVPRLIKPRDIFNMGEENSLQFASSMQSDATDLALLENTRVPEDEYNDWVRSGVDGIVIDANIHSQDSPNDGKASVEGENDNENEYDSEYDK